MEHSVGSGARAFAVQSQKLVFACRLTRVWGWVGGWGVISQAGCVVNRGRCEVRCAHVVCQSVQWCVSRAI
jgi:hypothetical protein